MSFSVSFTIPGEPVAKKAPVFTTAGGFPHAYPNKKTDTYENLVSMIARTYAPESPLETPISIIINAVFSRPNYLSKRSSRTGKLLHASEGRMPHITRPDVDNIAKSVLDGIKKIGIFRDDSQVAKLVVCKSYTMMIAGRSGSPCEEQPHVHVTVEELTPIE